MENPTHHNSCNTILADRVLWYDGETSWHADSVLRMTSRLLGVKYASEITPPIQQYNRFVAPAKQIRLKQTCLPLPPPTWTVPANYMRLDVARYAAEAHTILIAGMPPDEVALRERRLAHELILFKRMGCWSVLCGMIWLINTLTVNHVVWGVGRGSSVASYLLYVLGVHDVDSFAYELDVTDFLHE